MQSFDKVGKSVNEEHYLMRGFIDETLDLIRLINKIKYLKTNDQQILCRWLNLGIIENSKVYLDPLGTVTFVDWHDDYDSLIHGLLNVGIAYRGGNDYVVVPMMMQWHNLLGSAMGSVCTLDDYLIDEEEVVSPSPMYMRVPVGKEVVEVDEDDLVTLMYHRIKSLGSYISGKVVYVGANVRTLGFVNQVVFKTPVDLVVMTSDNSLIAHRILDPSVTVHRGYSAAEDYLMNGFDYVIIMHRYVNPTFHEEVVNDIINKPKVNNSGYAAIVEDGNYIAFYKWPRINELILKSPSVGMNRSLLVNSLRFVVNSQ